MLKLLILFFISNYTFAYEYGIDRLDSLNLTQKKIGLLAHSASINQEGKHLIDLLYPKYQVTKIFVPEHGLRSLNDDWIDDGVDEQTKLPIISLYKQSSRAPLLKDLANLDLVIVDLQDVGVRYYTYFSTIAEFMKVAAKAKVKIMILDRPNLLGGKTIEGEILAEELSGNFISYHTIPTRHGMTLGELALMINEEKNLNVDLEIIRVEDWNREEVLTTTDRPWTSSSPALTKLDQVYLYALWGSLEQFNLAVGRGKENSLAFKVIAAPWITQEESILLAEKLNELNFKGISFLPITFTATRDIFKDQKVQGVQISLQTTYLPLRTDEVTYKISKVLYDLFPERLIFSKMAPHYYGNLDMIKAIQTNRPWQDYQERLDLKLKAFELRRTKFLLY